MYTYMYLTSTRPFILFFILYKIKLPFGSVFISTIIGNENIFYFSNNILFIFHKYNSETYKLP